MTCYHAVEPEVAGGWGSKTELTRTPGRPDVFHKLEYRFEGWLGDALLESTPCFIATERLAVEIQKAKLSGVKFDEVEISCSEEFDELFPGLELPKFVWLKPEGVPGNDDFGVFHSILVVSERALTLLKNVGVSNAHVEPFDQQLILSREREAKELYGI